MKTNLFSCSTLVLPLFLLFLLFGSHKVKSAVLAKDKIWLTQSKLMVVFIDGTNFQKQQVKRYAPLWLEDSHLSFSFYDNFDLAPPKTHIRISFSSHTGSLIGNHGDFLSKEPTLLLNQLNQANLTESEIKRSILHEFGHALGFEHAYRNPTWPYGQLPIDQHISECVPKMQNIGFKLFKAEEKCLEVNSPLESSNVLATTYDVLSIMNYPQLILLEDGSYKQISAIAKLSVLDKHAIEQWYGKIAQ